MTGGCDADNDSEIRFMLEYGAVRSGEVFLDAGVKTDGSELVFDEEVRLPFDAHLRLDFTFGVDSDKQFFMVMDQLSAGVAIDKADLNVGVILDTSGDTPDVSLNAENGTVNLNAQIIVEMGPPNSLPYPQARHTEIWIC